VDVGGTQAHRAGAAIEGRSAGAEPDRKGARDAIADLARFSDDDKQAASDGALVDHGMERGAPLVDRG
jgi:hypothetical protein